MFFFISKQTLCIVVYRERWGALDGLGALIIVPVRELAIQTFEVLRSFGLLHEMSAGMIIGGKQVDIEKSRIASINILVATPGRLLQHMNETPDFNCDNLRMLVLDEVDRILDMGFSEDLNQIISFLPMRNVQTLLFSATAKKSLQKLAKKVLHSDFTFFSMNNYERSIGESANNDENQNKDEAKDDEMVAKYVTPVKLTHYYMCVEAEHKLDTLFSFIKSHKD